MEPHEKWFERERKSKSEGVSQREHPIPQRRAGLTGQHEAPHQHHVPWVLAHVCWRLQWLQHGRGGCLFEQKPQGRQLPRGHDGEVDPSLRKRRRAVRTGPRGPTPRLLHTPARRLDRMDPETKHPSGSGTGITRHKLAASGDSVTRQPSPSPPATLGRPHLPDLLHQTLRGAPGVRGALHSGQQVGGRVADEEADAVCLAAAKNKDRCGAGGHRALKRDPDPAQQGTRTPPTGSQEEWPHFTAENTEALRLLTEPKSNSTQGGQEPNTPS